MKSNVAEGKGNLQWKFNMEDLVENVQRNERCDITNWSSRFGLYGGRAFVNIAEHSHWVFLNTNTIPFYSFFPKLEARFPSTSFNFIQGDESPESNNYYYNQ